MLMVSLELDQCPTSLLISALLAAFQLWSSKMYTYYQEQMCIMEKATGES